MACLQHLRSSQDIQLLPNQLLSEQQSLVFIKKLLAIAVSGITYLRGLFPEKAFGTKYVADQKVMILKEVLSCPGATQMVQWMQGCFDAIQKKYLRAVIMSIYTDPENPQQVTEYYQFRISYTGKGAQMEFESKHANKVSAMSCDNTKKASILMVRKLYTLMQNLGPLPDHVCLNMKLAYYNDVTPQDYQPPGFKESDSDGLLFEKEPVKLTMGEVSTPFHSFKMDMATERHRLEEVEEGVHVTEKWCMKIMGEEEGGVMPQIRVIEEVENTDLQNTLLYDTETQIICDEKIESNEEVAEMDTSVVKKTSDVELPKRTRSGRIIRSMTKANLTVSKKVRAMKDKQVSQYEIPCSQETPSTSTSAPKKRRKFSVPKDH